MGSLDFRIIPEDENEESGDNVMTACENRDYCSFFQINMEHAPSVAMMMRETYCQGRKEACARYLLREKLLKGYALSEEDPAREKLEVFIEGLYPNDIDKVMEIISRLVK